LTTSVAQALPHLVKACQTDYLWIDQITIDQSNIPERSQQVEIMGKVYGQSHRALIWIDSYLSSSTEAEVELAWNQGAGDQVRNFLQSFSGDEIQHLLQSLPGEEVEELIESFEMTPQLKVKEHLLWFLEHPWFSRTWVYQEFVLARRIIFVIGDFELPGHEIENVFRLGWPRSAAWFDTFEQRLKINKSRATMFHRAPGLEFLLAAVGSRLLLAGPAKNNARRMSNDSPLASKYRQWTTFAAYESLTFADMIETMAASQTQDDRDHVYAFVGLAPFLLRHMRVDYSLSVEKTFAAMMKALVKEARSIDAFGYLPADADMSRSRLDLPSWAPNWTVKIGRTPILCHSNLFEASGRGYGLPWVTKCKHFDLPATEWNELIVAGKIIDEVRYKLKPFSLYQVQPNLEIDPNHKSARMPWQLSTLNRFVDEMVDHGFPDRQEISLEALLRTLLMDGVQWGAISALMSGKPLYRTTPEIEGLPHYEWIKDVIAALIQSPDPNMDELPHGATVQVLHELSKVQYQRRVVFCGKGKFGLAPDWAEKGDKIAILHGSRVPSVIRPRLDGNYTMVGECYYDGAMYGDMADPEDDNAELFKLV
jgi:hypothetical protein